MTDHADTIRRALHHPEWDAEGLAALDALLAERQQAQEHAETMQAAAFRADAEAWKESSRTWEARYNGEAVRLDKAERERQQAQRQIDTLSGRILNLETERRQAIDALREITEIPYREPGDDEEKRIARVALVKLGENAPP